MEKGVVGANALRGALSRQESALLNSLSDAELQSAVKTAELRADQSNFDNGPAWENTWSNNNPDSWPYPD